MPNRFSVQARAERLAVADDAAAGGVPLETRLASARATGAVAQPATTGDAPEAAAPRPAQGKKAKRSAASRRVAEADAAHDDLLFLAIGRDLADLEAAAASGAGDVARLRLALRVALRWCSLLLAPSRQPGYQPHVPSLGEHTMRRIELDLESQPGGAEAEEKDKDEGKALVYAQEQCTYSRVLTADHFLHSFQRARASAKLAVVPELEHHGRGELWCRLLPANQARQPCPVELSAEDVGYVELGGARGHPGRREADAVPDAHNRELYTVALPAVKLGGALRAALTADLVGVLTVRCASTGLEARVSFRPYDADAAPRARNVVSGELRRAADGAVLERVLGTWDTAVYCTDAATGAQTTLFQAPPQYPVPLTRSDGSTATDATARALRQPVTMELRKFWHAVADALHCTAPSMPEPLASVSARLAPGPGADHVSAKREQCRAQIEAELGLDEDAAERPAVPMEYEVAVMLADYVAPDVPPRLPGVSIDLVPEDELGEEFP